MNRRGFLKGSTVSALALLNTRIKFDEGKPVLTREAWDCFKVSWRRSFEYMSEVCTVTLYDENGIPAFTSVTHVDDRLFLDWPKVRKETELEAKKRLYESIMSRTA